MREFSVVTGAFSYTGRYIAQRLLALGQPVKTLTRHRPSGSDGGIEGASLDFADRNGLVKTLRGATTLYNTYWVRVPRGRVTFEQAVTNSQNLFEAAGAAGARRGPRASRTKPPAAPPPPLLARGGGGAEDAARAGAVRAARRSPLVYG